MTGLFHHGKEYVGWQVVWLILYIKCRNSWDTHSGHGNEIRYRMVFYALLLIWHKINICGIKSYLTYFESMQTEKLNPN